MTELPEHVMIDANVHSYLKENENFLITVVERGVELHLSAYQSNEIRRGLDNHPEKEREEILNKIQRVENLADPVTTSVDTSGFGEVFGYNFGGSTGEIYQELIEPHPNIREVDRPDAIGAEAAINRDMLFVTDDKGLQDKMKECDYEDYLLTLDDFLDLFND